MNQIVISVSNLTKTFAGKEVIRNCTFSVERGSIYGFLGRNGAGKTTMLKLLLGLLKPSAGTASVLGLDSVRDNEAILRRTGNLIETPIFYEHLSAADNLRLHLAYMGMADADVEPTLCRVGLPSAGNQPVATFSLGMRQRLAIARAIIHRPEVLILDEPVNGLDSAGMKEMRILFLRLVQEEGMTIMMSSHLLSEIEQIADRVGVITDGTVVQEAEMADNVIGEEVQMARTKNRGQQPVAPTYTARRWDAGKYIRLSKEDLKKAKEGKDDSNSVKNQRDLLDEFCERHADEFRSSEEYVDDGHTGTDADREDFQRLLSDVMSGKINCVIVKDLSRFARNYSDAGSLIDNLFVQMGVRFISLAENVDSYLNPDSVSNILVPITNVMNDNYCYQTSKKIRQVFDYKRRSGQYIGSFAPYGYVKDPEDKHRLVVDPEAAEVVKLIFSLFLRGTSKRAIALYLNEHDVPSPSAYRVSKGLPVPREAENPMWSSTSISKVLCNEIYTGDLIQGRRRVKSYRQPGSAGG